MEDDLRIEGFADAVSVLLGVHRDFGRAHAVALLASNAELIDIVVFAEGRYGFEAAIGYTICTTRYIPDTARLIFFSCEHGGATVLRESDVERAEALRSDFVESGIDVLDHLFVDGELIRSMAYSIGWPTWDAIHAGRYDDRG